MKHVEMTVEGTTLAIQGGSVGTQVKWSGVSSCSFLAAWVFRKFECFEAWVDVAWALGDWWALEIGPDVLQELASFSFGHVAGLWSAGLIELFRCSDRRFRIAAVFHIEPSCMASNRLIQLS
jgi:hypothetical protein